MGSSNIAEVDIGGTRQVDAGGEEEIIYYDIRGNGIKIRLRKWNKFRREWTIDERRQDCLMRKRGFK